MCSSLDQASKQEDNCGCIGLRSVGRWWWREASDERSSIMVGRQLVAGNGDEETRKCGSNRAGLMTHCLSIYIIERLGSDSSNCPSPYLTRVWCCGLLSEKNFM
jgi:hypothetical protein